MDAVLPVESLRERKKARTRDALVTAAMTLFESKGYEGTTVDEIAAAAEVSRRTFFRYFESKESIVFPHYRERIDRFVATAADRLPGESGVAAVRRGCVELGAELMRNRREMGLLNVMTLKSPALVARERLVDLEWETAFAEVLQADVETPEAKRRATYVAAAMIGVLRVAFREWHASGERLDLVQTGGAAIDLIVDGMQGGLQSVIR